MTAPKYKLTYFDFPGRAEPIRWMFAYKCIPFDDIRLKEMPSYIGHQPTPEWDALKAKTPYGNVPILEVDGKALGESHAIARYMARELGLSGANEWEAAQADSIITYLLTGFQTPLSDYVREQDKIKKQILLEGMKIRIKRVGDTLERILRENNGNSKGVFVGDEPTVADFVVVVFLDSIGMFFSDESLQFVDLIAHRDRMRSLPGVKEFLQKQTAELLL